MTSRDLWFSTADGLSLHAVDTLPAQQNCRVPLVCLAGLTRNSTDFAALAQVFATRGDAPRRVLALDSRGRGRSAHDPYPANYSLPIELDDVKTLLSVTGIERAIFVGSSRGGLLSLLLLAERPPTVVR